MCVADDAYHDIDNFTLELSKRISLSTDRFIAYISFSSGMSVSETVSLIKSVRQKIIDLKKEQILDDQEQEEIVFGVCNDLNIKNEKIAMMRSHVYGARSRENEIEAKRLDGTTGTDFTL